MRLKAEISTFGSVTVEHFMRTCLYDPEHGYYSRGGVFGAKGDFVTAPDISQVFGELIGLWCAVVWQQMGEPAVVNLVEFGPGRGTLMADALRAARSVPAFHDALRVHLVETSPALQDEASRALAGHPHVRVLAEWPEPEDLPAGPLIVIGNEFLDALPIEQFVFHDGGWRQRGVGIGDDGAFMFVPGAQRFPEMPCHVPATEGDIFEVAGGALDLAQFLDAHVQAGRLVAALLIDYGHGASGYGDTLQGVRNHRYVAPLAQPGEADLTAQVDFEALAAGMRSCDLLVEHLTTQAEFLGALGIVHRASRLMAANPVRAGDIEAGVARLMAPNGMGTRFKVAGVRSADLPALPGFAAAPEEMR